MQMLVLSVVRGCNLGEETGHHLNDVAHRHLADLVLRPYIVGISAVTSRQRPCLRERAGLVGCKALDVG
jgi:hypothetical protein